jgi:hypothetical protein
MITNTIGTLRVASPERRQGSQVMAHNDARA